MRVKRILWWPGYVNFLGPRWNKVYTITEASLSRLLRATVGWSVYMVNGICCFTPKG